MNHALKAGLALMMVVAGLTACPDWGTQKTSCARDALKQDSQPASAINFEPPGGCTPKPSLTPTGHVVLIHSETEFQAAYTCPSVDGGQPTTHLDFSAVSIALLYLGDTQQLDFVIRKNDQTIFGVTSNGACRGAAPGMAVLSAQETLPISQRSDGAVINECTEGSCTCGGPFNPCPP